jgi:hypothetical protein
MLQAKLKAQDLALKEHKEHKEEKEVKTAPSKVIKERAASNGRV